ncbi:MAG: hypothetical protein V4604_12240 [Bacteroidota bacterium]
MTLETNNPLDPVLDLTYEVKDGIYTYSLKISVPDACLNDETLSVVNDLEAIEDLAAQAELELTEDEVYDVVLLGTLATGSRGNHVTVTINNNPEGKAGAILVLISPLSLGLSFSPQTDGKAIIRFEKARP